MYYKLSMLMTTHSNIVRFSTLALGAVFGAALLFVFAAAPLLSRTLASYANPAFAIMAPVVAHADDYGWDGGYSSSDYGWDGGYSSSDYGWDGGSSYYDSGSWDSSGGSYGYDGCCGSYDYSYPDTYTTPTTYTTTTYTCPSGYTGTYPYCVPPVECPSGYTLHNGTCVPPTTCPSGYTLQNGTCVPPTTTCQSGYTLVNGVCTPPTTNCPSGYSMVNGVCTPPTSCPSGYTLQSGVCVPPTVSCPSGYTYNGSSCVPPVQTCNTCSCNNNCYVPPVQTCYTCNCNSAYCITQQPVVYQQQPVVSLYQTATAQPLASVSLSQIPYTGLDLGPWGMFLYWSTLVLLCAVAAYLIAVKKIFSRLSGTMKYYLIGDTSAATHPVYANRSAVEAHTAPATAPAQHGIDMHALAQALQTLIAAAAPAKTETTTAATSFKDTTDEFVLSQINKFTKR